MIFGDGDKIMDFFFLFLFFFLCIQRRPPSETSHLCEEGSFSLSRFQSLKIFFSFSSLSFVYGLCVDEILGGKSVWGCNDSLGWCIIFWMRVSFDIIYGSLKFLSMFKFCKQGFKKIEVLRKKVKTIRATHFHH